MAYLDYTFENQRYEIRLTADDTSLGRARECTVQLLHDPELSRVHCTIQRQADNSYVLLDETSTNGTYLNDERLVNAEYPLHDGDRIRIGNTVLAFHAHEGGRTTILFNEVEHQMEQGAGFHTIMDKILHPRPKGPPPQEPKGPPPQD